jgi:protein phosphatase
MLECASNPGRVRETNQDSAACLTFCSYFSGSNRSAYALLAVADGVGGGPAGDVASKLAIKLLVQRLAAELSSGEGIDSAVVLNEAIHNVHNEIIGEALRNPDKTGMASTLTVALCEDSKCHIGHVGDSRCYLLRGSNIRQLTVDHSSNGVLSQAVGAMLPINVFSQETAINDRDILILCTDGLSNYVNDAEIARIAGKAPSEQAACRLLIDAANERGGADNITVAIGKVKLELY